MVVGVSPDTVQSHATWKAGEGLPYILVADTDHRVAERYGVWNEKKMYGKTFWGVSRTTFVIDASGRIARVFTKVKPQGHATEVADALATHV